MRPLQSKRILDRGVACVGVDGVPTHDSIPDVLRRFREPEQLAILRIDDALLDHEIDIDRAPPVAFADQNDRYRLDRAGLNESEDSEQFVERAVTAGKSDQRSGPQQEVHLAQGEIVEAEAKPGRGVGVWVL